VSLVIFLNELSLDSDGVIRPGNLLGAVLSTLSALKAVKKIRRDIVVAGQTTISSVFFCKIYPLAEVLRDEDYRDEWRFIQNLDQFSPCGAYPASITPGVLQEVMFQDRAATGMLWATQNGSAVVSFSLNPSWNESSLTAQFREMSDGEEIGSREIQVPNLSKIEHVTVHRNMISDYDLVLSNSSIVYDGNGFVVRMFFNDHPPPHFHVMMRRDTSNALARYEIETLDLLSGELPSALRRRIESWATERKTDLLENWERCRKKRYPILLND
jgi:hypothetical protein